MSDNVLRSAIEVTERIAAGRVEGLITDVDMSKNGMEGIVSHDATFRRLGLHDTSAENGDFTRTKFSESSCRAARFDGSLFRGCSFFGSELIETRFHRATLGGTSFFTTRMGNADFTGARLTSCTFNSCELFNAKFSQSLLINTRFEAQERGNVTLDRADFSGAVLVDCDLQGGNLFGANFDDALLVKVDLRYANLTNASFKNARLVDCQVDTTNLEPAEARAIQEARLDDPWRSVGFMKNVLANWDLDLMALLMETIVRTYVIEAAQPAALSSDSFGGVLASLKARHDWSELEHLRMQGTTAQVRHGHHWVDIGAPLPAEVVGSVQAATGGGGDAPAPAAPAAAPAASGGGRPSGGGGGGRRMDIDPPAQQQPKAPPKNVRRSKRFRKLEMD